MIELNLSEEDICTKLGIDYNLNKDKFNHHNGSLCRGVIHKDITSQYNLSNYISEINKKDVKLSIDNVKEIYIQSLFDDIYITDLSRKFNVTCSTIQKIRDKKTWKHVTDNIDNQLGINRKVLSSTTNSWIVFNFKYNQ